MVSAYMMREDVPSQTCTLRVRPLSVSQASFPQVPRAKKRAGTGWTLNGEVQGLSDQNREEPAPALLSPRKRERSLVPDWEKSWQA